MGNRRHEYGGCTGRTSEHLREPIEAQAELCGRRDCTDVKRIDHVIVGAWATQSVGRLKATRRYRVEAGESLGGRSLPHVDQRGDFNDNGEGPGHRTPEGRVLRPVAQEFQGDVGAFEGGGVSRTEQSGFGGDLRRLRADRPVPEQFIHPVTRNRACLRNPRQLSQGGERIGAQ